MAKFVIEGGVPLGGRIKASGNKNAALPILACTLLSANKHKISNLPRIGDVETMLTLIDSMGGIINWLDEHTLEIDTANISNISLDNDLSKKVRGSILLAGPLIHRFGEASIPFPGGDRIGRRRIDTHLLALQSLGATIDVRGDCVHISAPQGLTGSHILLDEASVTATENTVMAAAMADGVTIIQNAACEPHVQELCRFLKAMGAEISGIGTNELQIVGKKHLSAGDVAVDGDYIEVGSLMVLAAVTGGELTIEGATPDNLRMILHQISRIGLYAEIRDEDLFIPGGQKLEVRRDFRGAIPKIDDAPWPGFPADMTSVMTVAATQAEGSIIIHEKMFESRMFFVDQLIEMGAQIVLCDPHRAVVIGPNKLHGAHMTSPDIRAGMALLIASLCAEGESVIDNIVQIDRGYERIDERLRSLGARIERKND